MSDYEKKIAEKVTQLFREAEDGNNWNGCLDRVVQLVAEELAKSFRNGVRWAQKRK